jgi:predicted DNA-binding WGR domain protein
MSGNTDINPLHSSLFTGAGTAWGPMQSGDPGDMPGIPGERKISDFAAFDESEMVKRLISNLRAGGAKEQMGSLRQASRMGAGQSDAARKGLRDIAANTEDRSRAVELDAAKRAWESQMSQKQFAEQMDMQRYAQALAQWQAKKGINEAEKAGRSAGLKNMMTMGGSGAFQDLASAIKK